MLDAYEGKCCDAVLRILEEQHGATRRELVRDTLDQPGVELTCVIGHQKYVLEHTLIEPFLGNQRDDIEFSRVLDDRFESEFAGLLDQNYAYDLTVDVYAFRGRSKKELQDIRRALILWVRNNIESVPAPEEWQQAWVNGAQPEAPVRVRLSRHLSRGRGGTLLAGRFAPAELEDLREKRLRKALEDKGPKLEATRSPGARTVLIFENRDIALTNASIVSETIEKLAPTLRQVPDDIFIIDVGTRNAFYVTQIRHAGRPCMLLGRDAGHWEFRTEDLVDI